jgi:hypothetical protein
MECYKNIATRVSSTTWLKIISWWEWTRNPVSLYRSLLSSPQQHQCNRLINSMERNSCWEAYRHATTQETPTFYVWKAKVARRIARTHWTPSSRLALILCKLCVQATSVLHQFQTVWLTSSGIFCVLNSFKIYPEFGLNFCIQIMCSWRG